MTNFAASLSFIPTQEQAQVLEQIAVFADESCEQDFFILNGAAGTGKTTVTKAVINCLEKEGIKFKIGAPTGRAAKVIAQKTGNDAKTLHSHIYTPQKVKNGGGVLLKRKTNTDRGYTIFIVDEASMVSDYESCSEKFMAGKPLLTDLVDFVKQGNQRNKVILIGDKNQLPPVSTGENNDISPALEATYLSRKFDFKGQEAVLNQVMRQTEGSKVLSLATSLRESMANGANKVNLDIERCFGPTQAKHTYLRLYEAGNLDKVSMICLTNRDVSWWNKVIRENLGFRSRISVGDVVNTQATWFNGSNLIYKGDTGIVTDIHPRIEEFAGLHFINAEISFEQGNGEWLKIYSKVLLESFDTQNGSLSEEQESILYHKAIKNNSAFRESENPLDDPYIGAMRLNYGYALTCHKAQGGEWDHVIIHPYQPKNDLRWLYTAITRARKEVCTWVA